MERSTREVEVKLAFATAAAAREAIERLGAHVRAARHFEDNAVFERDVDPLIPAGVLLRLRRVGARAQLTLKLPVEGEQRHKVREEHETLVADAAATERILRGLGLRPCWRYQKYRTTYALADLEICLDETPIGCFVELEGTPEAIDRVAGRLGFAPEQYLRETYRELHERHAREHGVAVGDLLIERAEPVR